MAAHPNGVGKILYGGNDVGGIGVWYAVLMTEDESLFSPFWSDIPDPYTESRTNSFSLDLNKYVAGRPSPVITLQSGTIPTGLNLSNGVLSGTFSAAGNFAPIFRATNPVGNSDSEEVNFTIT